MKKIILLLVIIASFQACSQKKTDDALVVNKTSKVEIDSNIILKLKNFYVLYFSEIEKENIDKNKLNKLLQKNLTSKLFNKIKNIDLDYDPIINGQDIDANWKKTLKIIYISEKKLYKMCTTTSFDNSKYCTYLKLDKTSEGYKIYDISVNNIPSILNYSNVSKDFIDKEEKYKINGKWKIDCEDARSLSINDDKEIFIVVQGNQISVNAIKLNKSTTTEYFYKLDKKPLNLGSGGNSLPWDEYLNDNEIFKIKILNNSEILFTWLGFFNKSTKEREVVDCEFTLNSGENPVLLIRCD